MKDYLTFGKTDGQTRIRFENKLKTGTARGIPLHHTYNETVQPKDVPSTD